MQPQYDVFLYKLDLSKLTPLTKLKDLEDLRLDTNEKEFKNMDDRKKYSDQLPPLFKKIPEDLKEGMEENFIVQRLQAKKYDKTNWLNLHKTNFFDKTEKGKIIPGTFSETIRNFKTELANCLKSLSIDENLITQTCITEYVLSITDFSTSLNSLENAATLIFDNKKLKDKDLNIIENDVVEIVVHYPEGSKPIFYGFVTNVSIRESYGHVVEYVVACAGISKFLYLSRVIQDPAIVSQFEQGIELEKKELTVFSHFFNNLNVVKLFDWVMTRVFGCQPTPTSRSDARSKYLTNLILYQVLQNYIAELNGIFEQFKISDLKFPRYTDTATKYKKILLDKGLNTQENPTAYDYLIDGKFIVTTSDTPPKQTVSPQYTKQGIHVFVQALGIASQYYKNVSDIKRKEYDQLKTLAETPSTIPYRLEYRFDLDKFKVPNSFQFSFTLLLLYALVRKKSSYSQYIFDDPNLKDVIAIYDTADDQQYKVYNIALISAFEYFYSQVTSPNNLLNDIRTVSFYDVFEDRPGIIRCRPPRYNVWLEDDVIDPNNIIEFSKFRNDAQLVSRVDYKFMFPYYETLPYLGGRFSDIDTLVKYGLRADAPKSNPNVVSPILGHFWSALDLIRSNIATRVCKVNVVADREYKLGCLYFIPNKGVTEQDILDAESRGTVVGIVGYVNSISTTIAYGTVSTHSLELIYVRKAEKVKMPDGTEKLNFYRIPDLETFMQWMEHLKTIGIDLSKGTISDLKQTAEEEKGLEMRWDENEAISWKGYYYAVDPLYYQVIKQAFGSKGIGDIDEIIRKRQLYRYACRTNFKVSDFAPKDKPGVKPFITQELINRLFLFDVSQRHLMDIPSQMKQGEKYTIWITTPSGNKDRIAERQEFVRSGWPVTKAYLKHIGSYIAMPDSFYLHNGEFIEFNNIENSDLGKLLDTYLEGKTISFKNEKWLLTTTTPTYKRKGSWYCTDSINKFFEFALFTISALQQFNIENIINAGGLYRGWNPSTNLRDPHYQGLAIDIVPGLLEYWPVSELDISSKAMFITNTLIPNEFQENFLSQIIPTQLDSVYIRLKFKPDKLICFQGWLRDHFKIKVVEKDDNSEPLIATIDKQYLSLLKDPDSPVDPKYKKDYTYVVKTLPYWHLEVADAEVKNGKAFFKERIRFKINYDTSNEDINEEASKEIYRKWSEIATISAQLFLTEGYARILGAGVTTAVFSHIWLVFLGVLGGLTLVARGVAKYYEKQLEKVPYKSVNFWFEPNK